MSLLLPGVASVVVSLILLVLGLPSSTALLAAAAAFPVVYLIAQQTGVSTVKGVIASGKGLLEEEEERFQRKVNKKQKKAEEAKKKNAQKIQQEQQLQATKGKASESAGDEDEDEEGSPSSSSTSTEEKKSGGGSGGAMTKTAAKKAKKEAAKKAEEERQKAEAEAKKKAEEADKKKKKKAAKKEGGTANGTATEKTTTASAASSSTVADSPVASKASSASIRDKEEGGWEVQKSDKPSSNKAGGSNKVNSSITSSANKVDKSASTKGGKGGAGEGEVKESNSSPEAYEEMYIPFKNHAQLIGAKGATLQQLQNGTGAKIDMPKKDSGSTKVQLTGSPDAVKAAKGAIDSLINKGYSTITHPGWVHDDINVEERHFGLIIGPGGKYIQAIQSKTSTRINLPDKDSGSHKVVIVGKKEDVRSARLAIKELIADGFSPLTHDNFVKREVAFPKDKLHVLIGAKGQTIKSIQGNSKAKINIPERGSGGAGEDVHISVVGTPEAVAQAEKEIARLLIPIQVVEEEPEEEYRDGTWSQAGQTEDDLWE